MSNAELSGAIDDMFVQCTSSTGSADLKAVMKTFWPVLDNRVSMVDLAGVFTMCVSSVAGPETLDLITFAEFFNGIARVKYSSGADYCEKLLKELKDSKGIKIKADLPLFQMVTDKSIMRVLLKYDMPLRRVFSGFAGQNINVGGGLTWEEVQKLSIGMEVSGFSSFAGAHNLIPATLSLTKTENLARDVLTKFPLNASGNALHSALLYPQFQLALCFTAYERQEAMSRKNDSRKMSTSSFARKSQDASSRPLSDMLVDLVRDLGIDKTVNNALEGSMASATEDPFNSLPPDSRTMRTTQSGASITYPGKVVMPTQERPENQYTGTINHSRHAQLMRMDNLFEEVEAKVLKMLEPGSDVMGMIAGAPTHDGDSVDRDRTSTKLTSKPVVIGDAVPVPPICPEPVEQLLQAALAHHNLGSFEEALKFLEAARMQLEDISRRVEPAPLPVRAADDSADEGEDGDKDTTSEADFSAPEPAVASIPLDLELYVTLCKGNVYQSCGDDEQSLLHYMDGWDRALADADRDWEIVCLNSIGTLAYYSLRYDVALLCFGAVAAYRQSTYGLNSADTATAWNNEAASMFCLGRRAESRLRFEKGWAVMCKVLGHRAPRSVTTWKNLEKSRRAAAASKSSAEGMAMRPDIDRLVLGGTFMVQATVPVESTGKKKKGGKKKK
jgi:tetratricopeptide (TPR) repeat protein